MLTVEQKAMALLRQGYTIGQRDARLNTDYPGQFMVVEEYTVDMLPTRDGANGPWCVVGNDLEAMIHHAYNFQASTEKDNALSKTD